MMDRRDATRLDKTLSPLGGKRAEFASPGPLVIVSGLDDGGGARAEAKYYTHRRRARALVRVGFGFESCLWALFALGGLQSRIITHSHARGPARSHLELGWRADERPPPRARMGSLMLSQ